MMATTTRKIATTVLCCGLNVLAERMRQHPKLARWAVVVLALNEARGIALVWESRHAWLPIFQ